MVDGVSTEPRAQTPPRLATGQTLPDLRIIPGAAALLHEECDPTRVARLSMRLREDGILRNPPIVAPLPQGSYVVLDGANRTAALTALRVSAIPVHVVDYDDPAIRVEVWHHLLLDAADLLARLADRGLLPRPGPLTEAIRGLEERKVACYVLTPHEVQMIPSGPSMRHVATILTQVVDAYKGTARIYRVVNTDLDVLSRQYGPVGAVIVFPRFSKSDIREMAYAATKLPTGITRHLITGRALRLNVPIDVLASSEPVEAKNQWLRELVHQKLLDNRIRYYPEASFLFDE